MARGDGSVNRWGGQRDQAGEKTAERSTTHHKPPSQHTNTYHVWVDNVVWQVVEGAHGFGVAAAELLVHRTQEAAALLVAGRRVCSQLVGAGEMGMEEGEGRQARQTDRQTEKRHA